MQYHINKHHTSKDFVCNGTGCQKTFETFKQLRKHQRECCGLSEQEREKAVSWRDEQTETTSIWDVSSPSLCLCACIYDFENSTPYFELEENQVKCEPNVEPESEPEPKKVLHVENEEKLTKQKEEKEPSEIENSSKILQNLISGGQCAGLMKDLKVEGLLQSMLGHLRQENHELKEKLSELLTQCQKEIS